MKNVIASQTKEDDRLPVGVCAVIVAVLSAFCWADVIAVAGLLVG